MQSTDIYSQLKPAWHPDRIEDFRNNVRPRPIHVQLILSDLCNQDCYFCAYRMSSGLSTELFAIGELAKVGTNNPKRLMPRQKALEIIEDCVEVGVKAIQFTGGGEPTVHLDHLEIIDYAQRLGLQTALVTNGTKLGATLVPIHRLDWIRVSIDAGDSKTYARVRRAPERDWHKVWGNIRRLRWAGYEGVLGIGYVVTPGNYEGIVMAARLAREVGADNMRVGAVFSAEGTSFYYDSIPRIVDTIAAAKEEVDDDSFTLVDLFGRRLSDLEEGSPSEEKCYYQYLTPYIGADLWVYRCCNTAYTTAGRVADLRERRLRDVFPFTYEPFDARQCRFCQFQGQNRAIHALVHEPKHVNFV